MSGFFGFDAALPERRQGQHQQQQQQQYGGQQQAYQQAPGGGAGAGGFGGFQGTHATDAFSFPTAGEEEDLAVYTWGDGMGASLLEGNDDLNDETFGDIGPVGNDFVFGQPSGAATTQSGSKSASKGPVASTHSRYKPKVAADPFAFSEDDFYASRTTNKSASKPTAKATKPKTTAQPQPAARPAPAQAPVPADVSRNKTEAPMWGADPSTSMNPPPSAAAAGAAAAPPAGGQIRSLEEIEAEMLRMTMPSEAPKQPQVVSLHEVERQMAPPSAPQQQQQPQPAFAHPQQPSFPAHAHAPSPFAQPPQQQAPPREVTPPNLPALGVSGYDTQKALLDSMFPQLGSAVPTGPTPQFPGQQQPPKQPSPEELARMQALHQHITAKIESMSRYNHLMGSSDKDFITRIQLSQLVTPDPYSSDFYAQVYSALKRRQIALEAEAQAQRPDVVEIAPGAALGVSGPAGNRFGKMGTQTMQKLSTQVKKLVESRNAHQNQKSANTAALQGALGKVSRGGVAAPRPVLAVPTGPRPENRPITMLNQGTGGPRRQPLTKKQVMIALEDIYSLVLELEQHRRDVPPPDAVEEIEAWNARCSDTLETIWRRLMITEPLDISDPHPFVSLMNPPKGQRLIPRLLRHLPQQKALTLLTLLIATYSQLDVVARAAPPPSADMSLMSKAARDARAQREAETDNFLHCVVPGMDIIINQCPLSLISGLLGVCAQRMNVGAVARTRPGVALFTALLSRAKRLTNVPAAGAQNPQAPPPDVKEVEHWNATFNFFLQHLLPHLNDTFPSAVAQRAAFGPGAYLMSTNVEREGVEMERREAEAWGLAAALAVNAQEDQQTSLVAALRDKIVHTVQTARDPSTPPARAQIKLHNANMFLNGLGLDASMI